jgi:NADH:ubiquinone oxidoreductase subunit H
MISVFYLSEILIVLVPVLMTIAFVTIAERKVMAAMQRRCGPNAVGTWGVLQPFADALKLLVKEIIRPRHSNSMLFVLGPCITLTFALLGWAIIPFGEGLAIFDFELGVFFALAVSSLGGYGILISGWSANSKYAFLGAIRATAQLLSYELVFSSIVLILILLSGSFSLTYIVECQQAVWYIFPLMPIALAFFIAILAETNRPPFDLAEAESELVAGLCELWLNFFLISKYINHMAHDQLGLYWAPLNKGWNTISWVLGLMQYRNNNLNYIIGIGSDLYCLLVKYVDKIINPLNGYFCYKKGYYNLNNLRLLNNKLYTWTSKIMDPSERYTPCIEIVPFENYMVIHNKRPYNPFGVNKGLILFYKFKPGNPMFYSLSLDAKYDKSDILEYNLKLGLIFPILNIVRYTYNFTNKYMYKWKILSLLVLSSLLLYAALLINITLIKQVEVEVESLFRSNTRVLNLEKKGIDISYIEEGNIELQTRLKLKSNKVGLNENNNLKSEHVVLPYNKRIISGGNYSQNMLPELYQKKMKSNNNKRKKKTVEKNKTKSRSNKWKYIISEKSRKHIILGCEGKTYLEKLANFYNSWWNYYIIRKCNTGEILYEYHNTCGEGIRILHSRFKPPYEKFPNKINAFLNYSNKFLNYNLENRTGIINDNKIDECTELYLYFNNRLRVKDTSVNYFKLDYYSKNEPHFIESNIEQYYSFCNNVNVYVGWVSIIRINNYSAQPTYYNNLIKRYHKEWINMLKYWVVVPNYNLKWNSNTKMNDTNLLGITTIKDGRANPALDGIGLNDICALFLENKDMKSAGLHGKLSLSSNLNYEHSLSDPFIPNKYEHKFNYLKITIKNIKNNDDLYNKYTKNKKIKNKLPWKIKELITDHVEINSREFVKIQPKFK